MKQEKIIGGERNSNMAVKLEKKRKNVVYVVNYKDTAL